ncbi:ribosome maturation factor RimP [Ilumatobacter sp.]|uniref:ribosome maturation factor RimP n=1 Tax=Ilumatobacter sp. TaxID=1967498 RepID=UPI003B52905F
MANEMDRVRALVEPITSDLGLDLYDVERRSAVVRVTVDTPPGSDGGIDLDALALATRLIGRELDHEDPIAGKYTLEVTSPGLERPLRTPAHFRREVGKDVTVRLRGDAVAENEDRRIDGRLVAADETSATIATSADEERSIDIASIDKARTVFEWGPAPKPGKGPGNSRGKKKSKSTAKKEKQES